MTRAVLSIGSNLGDRMAHLQGAIDALAVVVDIVAVSRVYETAPVGGPDQDDFLNAVLLVDIDLEPHALLVLCQQVEAQHDRIREVHWGPRTLDVDIISIDGIVLSEPELTVPHPRAHERAFVCVPWLDADPHAVLPQGAVAELALDATGVVGRPDLILAIPGGDGP